MNDAGRTYNSMYPQCGKCEKGVLLPVNMGKGGERDIKYRCTNPACNARFDVHGYEVFDVETQSWVRVGEG